MNYEFAKLYSISHLPQPKIAEDTLFGVHFESTRSTSARRFVLEEGTITLNSCQSRNQPTRVQTVRILPAQTCIAHRCLLVQSIQTGLTLFEMVSRGGDRILLNVAISSKKLPADSQSVVGLVTKVSKPSPMRYDLGTGTSPGRGLVRTIRKSRFCGRKMR